ncbi:MAG: rhamnulokinase [Verrucomicrobia bacterium]|nr:MAG: rhamnulokinase [Verrucomicrobiota bacterium]
MAKTTNYLALDLGAESGRAIVGTFDGKKLVLKELHRFPNGPVKVGQRMHWDALRLFAEMKTGLKKAQEIYGKLESLGIDTWGVDFGLLDAQGELLGNPVHYRDARTDGMVEAAFKRAPRAAFYRATGIQFMQLNSVFQLFALAQAQSPQLAAAKQLLFMPDLFNYWFTDRAVIERTIASTSQCLDPKSGKWATAVLKKLGIPTQILGKIVEPGAVIGSLTAQVAEETGAKGLKVVAPGGHDTACAVAAVPAAIKNYAYLSSGTWSLMGMELDKPVVTDASLKYNFTNEGGVCDTIRFLKNISGLWLVQECRRTWAARGEELDYATITKQAAAAPSLSAFVDPNHADFLTAGDMPARIQKFCKRTGQKVPKTKGEIIRVALESLAMKYRWVLERLEELTGQKAEVLHIVGGGTQNKLLNQLAANAVGRPVITGPIEATAVGNILMQMLATKKIKSLAEGRKIVRASFPTDTYKPQTAAAWDAAYQRFLKIQG